MEHKWEWAVGAVIIAVVVAVGARSIVEREMTERRERHAIASKYACGLIPVRLDAFAIDVGRLPTPAEGIAALLKAPLGSEGKWKGPYLEGREAPLDPWRHEYRYQFPGIHNPKSYDVWSLGPDGVASADDIGNW